MSTAGAKPNPLSLSSIAKAAFLVAAGTAKNMAGKPAGNVVRVNGGAGAGSGGATVSFPGYANTGVSRSADSGMGAAAQFQFAYPNAMQGMAAQAMYDGMMAVQQKKQEAREAEEAAAAAAKAAANADIIAKAAKAVSNAEAAAKAKNSPSGKKELGGGRRRPTRKTGKKNVRGGRRATRKQVSRKQVSRR